MRIETDPKVDYAFKHVFGREQSKPVAISLLNAVLAPFGGQSILSIELLNPFNEKEAIDDKLSVLDIKARDQSGRQFNIEMQMLAYGVFRPRELYYWSRLHQGQLREGDDYGALRPTIAVCFVDTPLFPELPDYHLVFELRERRHHVLFTDQMAVHILELAKFSKTIDELQTPLDRWLYFLRHAEGLDAESPPEALSSPELRWALKDLLMISQTDHDRELYESRLKMRRDISAALAEAKEAGEAEGLQKGIEKGIERGRIDVQIQRIRFLQRLLHREIGSLEELQARSLSGLEQLAAGLEYELSAKLVNGE